MKPTILPFASLVLWLALGCQEPSAFAADVSSQDPPQEEQAAEPQAEVLTQAQLEAWTEEIRADIEELRAKSFLRPVTVALADLETLQEYIKVRMEKTEPPEQREANVTVAKMLGLVPGEMDFEAHLNRILEGQVGGFYDPDTEGFFLMETFSGSLARPILAHELTHALDDQLYDIDGTLLRLEGNSDAQWAYHAVIEGSGSAVGQEWVLTRGNLSPAEQMEDAMRGMDVLADALPYVYKPLLGSYLRGQMFLCRAGSMLELAKKKPGLEDYATVFENPPRSSEQVLHSAKYWDEEKRDEPVPVVLDTEALPPGWAVLHQDTLGELGWALFVEPPAKRTGLASPLAIMAVRYTYPASEGWGGDRYVLLGRGEARVLLCETTWDSDRDAEEFGREVEKLEEHLVAGLAGTAQARGLTQSGTVSGSRGARGRWLRCWIGVSPEEAAAVANSIGVRVGE